jgi:hypothetical protein
VWLTGGSELPVPVGINNGCVCVQGRHSCNEDYSESLRKLPVPLPYLFFPKLSSLPSP